MPSTSKTPNLGLCQWVETDPFLMADMNDTLAKLDTAVGRLNEAIEGLSHKRLFDVTISQQVISTELDFTGIDLSQFAELAIYLSFRGSSSKYMRVNGVSESLYSSTGVSSTSDKMRVDSAAYRLVLDSDGMYLRSKITGSGYSMSKSNFPQINTFEFFGTSSSSGLNPGDRITIWGVRK